MADRKRPNIRRPVSLALAAAGLCLVLGSVWLLHESPLRFGVAAFVAAVAAALGLVGAAKRQLRWPWTVRLAGVIVALVGAAAAVASTRFLAAQNVSGAEQVDPSYPAALAVGNAVAWWLALAWSVLLAALLTLPPKPRD